MHRFAHRVLQWGVRLAVAAAASSPLAALAMRMDDSGRVTNVSAPSAPVDGAEQVADCCDFLAPQSMPACRDPLHCEPGAGCNAPRDVLATGLATYCAPSLWTEAPPVRVRATAGPPTRPRSGGTKLAILYCVLRT